MCKASNRLYSLCITLKRRKCWQQKSHFGSHTRSYPKILLRETPYKNIGNMYLSFAYLFCFIVSMKSAARIAYRNTRGARSTVVAASRCSKRGDVKALLLFGSSTGRAPVRYGSELVLAYGHDTTFVDANELKWRRDCGNNMHINLD